MFAGITAVFLCACLAAYLAWETEPVFQESSDFLTNRSISMPPPLLIPNQCQNIYKLVCQKGAETHDPTGSVSPDVVGEQEAMRLYQSIVEEHENWTPEEVDEELVKRIFNFKNRTRLEAAYRWVLLGIERYIDHQPDYIFTPTEKRALKSRLERTHLQIPPPASTYADEPDLFTKTEVYYERTPQGILRLRVGGAYVFIAQSWFNLIFTMAHELAHSIDPCEIRTAHLSFPAYDRLTACFLSTGLIPTRKTRTECADDDQLPEAFADWLAAQVTSEALVHFSTEFRGPQIIAAVSNSVRDLCEQEGDMSDLHGIHPTAQVRIEKIFGQHPVIRQLLGCEEMPEQTPYCSFDAPLVQPPPTGKRGPSR